MENQKEQNGNNGNRRHKTALTILSEILSIPIVLLLLGLLIQIGEYKANFKHMCERVEEIKIETRDQFAKILSIIDASAAETKSFNAVTEKELARVRERVARIEGRRQWTSQADKE